MIGVRLRIVVIAAAVVSLADVRAVGIESGPDERLWQYRNLGKAFYENPTTQGEAVEQFRKALDLAPESARERLNYGLALLRAGKTEEGIRELEKVQQQDPALPHTWFNLGIQYKKRGTDQWNARAIQQFEQMVRLVGDEPVSHFNLGYLYKIAGRPADALREFETAARLAPTLAGPHFQLYNAYRDPAVGRLDDARREQERFQEIKRRNAGAVIPEDLEWGYYAEIYDPADAAAEDADPPPRPPSFAAREILRLANPSAAALVVFDADHDQRPDAIVWSTAGVYLLKGGDTIVHDSGLESLEGVVSIAPADYDNDGAVDLAVMTRDGAMLWHHEDGLRFAPQPAPLAGGHIVRAAWLDYDHDYDLDLLLFGDRNRLFRNSGPAGFVDVTAEFPFAAGQPLDAVVVEATADAVGRDVLVSYRDRGGVLYRDELEGKFKAEPLNELPEGSSPILARDINRDGWVDVITAAAGETRLLLNSRGHFATATGASVHADAGLAAADFERLGVTDLVVGDRLLRWTKDRLLETHVDLGAAVARATADFNADGRLDLLTVDGAGRVGLALNTSDDVREWLRVSLTGVKNLRSGAGAVIEVKAGTRYQKALYEGVPVVFGLGERTQVDTVRITWPNGLVQNELRQRAGAAIAIKEAPRLSGSCPMIFTWDGARFRFITDVLGVAPLGASAGDGTYFPVDRDEYVQVPADALAISDGEYEVRVTEELREVSYLDRIQLIAVDHPAATAILTNDKFKAPPFPEFRLFGVDRPIPPHAAYDDRGRDVLDALLMEDRRYPDGYRRDFKGVAQPHHLDLDFGSAAPDNRALLVLNGWVDWADGSTFRGAAQEGAALLLPSLQVKDARGAWQTVIEDMGIPAGKPKTIVVDLTGRFLSASREVRIVTNLCVYWDRIYLSDRIEAPDVVQTPLDPVRADLRFRGFSRAIVDPERKQPEAFDYQDVRPVTMWNPTPGLYTRFGDVRPLLAAADDRLVVMGSGDEVRLRFGARRLPRLADGWRRDFLLLFVGWAKDGDANTAFSQTVDPLPFRGMSAYPYPAAEQFPHDDYARAYNTRPALHLLRSLAPRTGR